MRLKSLYMRKRIGEVKWVLEFYWLGFYFWGAFLGLIWFHWLLNPYTKHHTLYKKKSFIAKLSHKLRKHKNITILNLITEPALLLLIIFENQHLFLQKISSYPSLPFPSISQFHFVMDHFRPLSKPNHPIGSIRSRCLNNYKTASAIFPIPIKMNPFSSTFKF